MENRQGFLKTDFKVREAEEGNSRFIEGYFIRFNEETELWPGAFEEVSPESIVNSLKTNDIRCLFNHNTGTVLGRTGNHTLELRKDDMGLFGSVEINQKDKEAMDILARVERGDINACSFGFNIISEEIQQRDDGSVKFILKEIDLKEVSAVTFPAYPTTSIEAREQDLKINEQRKIEAIKNKLNERLGKLC